MNNDVCIYLRLSREDGDSNESNSISNQRSLIESFCISNGFNIINEYIDDGFSGTNFQRPQFKEMIKDLELGKFKTIIVKDLSRFGRDYIESGKYLQKIFPEKGIRFISVNDNYDSDNADVSDTHLILPIRNFINDSYCRDISMKVKSSKDIKRKNGEFIGAFAPFGYKKSDNNKHQLIIDKEVSHIIKRIFDMKIEGYSSNAIANFLNKIGMVTPAKHKENLGTNYNTGFVSKKSKWDSKMINRIIKNKVYLGTLEQGKTTKLNYKSKKEIKVTKSDWIITNNAHDPIVTKSVFDLANKMLFRDLKKSKAEPHILTGMLYCKDCNSPMVRRKVKNKSGYNVFYICSEYNITGNCTRHSIKEDFIINATIYAINKHLDKYNELLEKVNLYDVNKLSFDIDFESLNKEKKKYEKLRQSLYMDLEEELITSEEFERFRKNYLVKIREIEKQIISKQNVANELKTKLQNKKDFILEFMPNDDKLNRLSLVYFIDKVEISEDSKINFAFNNIEVINLLKSITDDNKEEKAKPNVITLNRIYANRLESSMNKMVVGGVN